MRAQTRPTDDPDCRLSTPWGGLSPREQRDLIKSLGGGVAAADHFLSIGHAEHFERNRRIRDTQIQGREIDLDRDDLSVIAAPRRYGQGPRRAPLAPARLLDRDAWNSILGASPRDIKDRDVLVASAQHGAGEAAAIAAMVGISVRQVRNCQDALLAWAREHLDEAAVAAHLDDPITQEAVARRPPSRAGRKPRRVALPETVGVVVDLWGHHHQPQRRGRGPDRGPRRPRARPVCEGQLGFWDHLEAA